MTSDEIVSGPSGQPPADYLAETKRLYDSLGYESYRWAERKDPPPFVPLTKPLAETTVLLISSGGVYRRGQIAFTTKDDTSIRAIAADTPSSELRTAHFAYDQADARTDPNCVFPLQRLHDLAADGTIGAVADTAYTFMGGIYSTRKLEAETVPLLVEHVEEAKPDVVLLVPV